MCLVDMFLSYFEISAQYVIIFINSKYFVKFNIFLLRNFMCITKVAQPGNFLNVQFGIIDFFVFLENQNKTGSTRGGSTKEARLY